VSRIAIVTDSTACIPEDLVKQYDIKVAPQILLWKGETLLDGVDITPDQFYTRLRTTDVMPTTSQATVRSFHEIFTPLVAEGAHILAIVLSAKLSGTWLSAEQAKGEFPGATIELVDSQSVAMGLGFQVLAAARAAADGRPFDEVVAVARAASPHTGVMFVVDTLEFLHRGGRIGGAARLFGTALNMKPLLEVRDGQVDTVEKIRTKAKAFARLLDLIEDRVGDRKPVRLAALHAQAEEDARYLLDEAGRRCQPVESLMTPVSPVVGNHAGPGTVGLIYCTEL
jgi:fatty acid kinase fatty acid binding subunit